MGIEGIIDKIINDADAKIEGLSLETRAQIEVFQKEAEDYKIKVDAEAQKKAESAAKKQYEQNIAKKEAELRKRLLLEKRRIIDSIFEKAKQRVLSTRADEVRKYYLSMLVSFGEKRGKILFGKKDSPIFDENFLKMASEKTGGDFTEEPGDFDHGFVLVVDKISFDARLSSIFDDLREKLADKIAKMLFEGNPGN